MDKIFKGHDIITYDDILTTEETNYFEQLFFYSNRFPWYQRKQTYTVSTAHGNYFKDNEAIKDGPMMVHEFWNNGFDIHSAKGDDDKRKSEHYRLADMLMQKVCVYFKIEGIDLIRAKANLMYQMQNGNKDQFNTPHTDTNDEHFVCIYFINDSDGDTLFFNKIPFGLSDREYEEEMKKLGQSKIVPSKKITPKKGRFLFFKGNIIHTGQHPINSDMRMIVNIDFKGEKNE
ncbi:MAG: hypothetical protein CMO44_13465 [Verrucomicrobiales bacterium]|nr:hypothetical protein [Verrucomicrobiales bacterium]|tara:strand:+ start:15401 stop:16093 length:693 start_codon:yes stop_codon:yes gene_type:complete